MPSAKYDNTDGRLRGSQAQKRRMRIWAKRPYCAMCGKLVDISKGTDHPFHLDHRIALVNGGKDEDENLQVLCVEKDGSGGCHAKKTAADMGYLERAEFDKDGRVVW